MSTDVTLVYCFADTSNGLGPSVATVYNHHKTPNTRAVLISDPEMVWTLYLIKRKNQKLSEHASIFWNMVTEHCLNNPYKMRNMDL